jgi:hypothetical protein
MIYTYRLHVYIDSALSINITIICFTLKVIKILHLVPLRVECFAFAHLFPRSFDLLSLFLESIDSFQFNSFKVFHSSRFHFLLKSMKFHRLFLKACNLDYASLLSIYQLSKLKNPYHFFDLRIVSLNNPSLVDIKKPFNQAIQLIIFNPQLLKDNYFWSIDSYQRNLNRFLFNETSNL